MEEIPEAGNAGTEGKDQNIATSDESALPVGGFVTLDYLTKGIFLGAMVGAVVFIVRKRQGKYQKVSDKDYS